MIYSLTINTPANTAIDAPLLSQLKLSRGLIYQFDIYFPPGSSGLLGVAVFKVNQQIYPFNRGSFFIGDNTQVSFNDLQALTEVENIMEIHTYNLDTDYEHQVQVRFGLVARLDFQSSFVPAISFDKLDDTIKELNTTMEAIKTPTVKTGFSLFKRG